MMTLPQMGALRNINRPVLPQSIVPGSGRYDYVSPGDNGRQLPAVGSYPSGAPYRHLAGRLADDGPGASDFLLYALYIGAALAAAAYALKHA